MTEQPAPTVDPEIRKRALAQAIAVEVAGGGRVETQSEVQAVVVTGKKVNNILHFLITALTCGVWAFVWIYLAVARGEKRTIIAVDDYGNVARSRV